MWPRRLGGIAVGIVSAMLLIMGIEFAGHMIWPPPPGLNPQDPAQITELLKTMPLAAQLWIPLSYFVGTFGGCTLALRLSGGWMNALWVVLAIILLSVAMNLMVIPHPTWLAALAALAPLLAALLARALRRPS